MKGQILGYDEAAGTGAISGEDGKRYSFSVGDWKSDKEPKAGNRVDFVVAGDAATDIYREGGAGLTAPDMDLSAITGNATLMGAITKPHLVGAALIIVGWLVAGHLLLVNNVFDAIGGLGDLGRLVGVQASIILAQIGFFSLLLFYLIPLAAGWLVFTSLQNQETARQKGRAWKAGIILPIAVPAIAWLFIWLGITRELPSRMAGEFDMFALIDIDLGFLLMIAGGVLVLLNQMGMLKSFGKPG